MSTFHVDVSVAARAVAARRRCSSSRELSAGSRRAPSERAPCAPCQHQVASPRCLPLRRPVTAPQPEIVPTFHADVAVADRAVVVRHRCSPSRERGAGSRRAPRGRTACAPQPPPWHRLVTRALLDAHHRATARGRVGLPCRPRRRRPRCRSSATLLALFQASAPAHAARRARAPLARLCRPVTSPRCSASAMRTHRATARDHADFPCRRRRCRPRRCCASTFLAPLPARRRLPPRAELARPVRAHATP